MLGRYDADGGGWGKTPDWAGTYNFFPDTVKPFVALAIPHEGWGMAPSYNKRTPAADGSGNPVKFQDWVPSPTSGVPFVIKTGGPDGPFDWFLEPAQVERLLQTHSNFLGLVVGEMTWSFFDA